MSLQERASSAQSEPRLADESPHSGHSGEEPGGVSQVLDLFRLAAGSTSQARQLVQQVVDGLIGPGIFVYGMRECLGTPAESFSWLASSVKRHLKEIRDGLVNGNISILGINPPHLHTTSSLNVTEPNIGTLTHQRPSTSLNLNQSRVRSLQAESAEQLNGDAQLADSRAPIAPTPSLATPHAPTTRLGQATLNTWNFLTGFLTLRSGRTPFGKRLVQDLINGRIGPDAFVQALCDRGETPPPPLVDLLKAGVQDLRRQMIRGIVGINGITPPPVAMINFPDAPVGGANTQSGLVKSRGKSSRTTPSQTKAQQPLESHLNGQRTVNQSTPPVAHQQLPRQITSNTARQPMSNLQQPPPPPSTLYGPYSKFTYNCAYCGDPFPGLQDNVLPTKDIWLNMHFDAGREGQECIRRSCGHVYFADPEGMSIVDAGLVLQKAHCSLCGNKEIDAAKMEHHLRMAHSQATAPTLSQQTATGTTVIRPPLSLPSDSRRVRQSAGVSQTSVAATGRVSLCTMEELVDRGIRRQLDTIPNLRAELQRPRLPLPNGSVPHRAPFQVRPNSSRKPGRPPVAARQRTLSQQQPRLIRPKLVQPHAPISVPSAAPPPFMQDDVTHFLQTLLNTQPTITDAPLTEVMPLPQNELPAPPPDAITELSTNPVNDTLATVVTPSFVPLVEMPMGPLSSPAHSETLVAESVSVGFPIDQQAVAPASSPDPGDVSPIRKRQKMMDEMVSVVDAMDVLIAADGESGEKADSKAAMTSHVETRQYVCKCGEVLSRIGAMNTHCARHLTEEEVASVSREKRMLVCPHKNCSYRAVDQTDYQRHCARHILLQCMYRKVGLHSA